MCGTVCLFVCGDMYVGGDDDDDDNDNDATTDTILLFA